MFQFSDDFDADFEDLLNVTLNNNCNETIMGSIVNRRQEYFVSTHHDDSKMVKDNLSIEFDAIDEEESILTAVEDIDNSFKEKCADQPNCETIAVHDKLCENSISPTERSLNTSSGSDNSYISWSTDFDSHQKLNVYEAQHKLMVSTGSPTTSKLVKIKYERKFPGPAGLIASKSNENTSPSIGQKRTIHVAKQQLEINSTEHSLFENSPWQQLLKDVNTKSCDLFKIINEYTVACVKRMNIIVHKSRKIPLFAAVIHHLDATVSDPSIILKDPSGEIRGTLHKDLWELYNHLLPVGSAVLLKQVSVLSIASSRKLYLNITRNNLMTIYTPQTEENPVMVTNLLPVSISDCVQEMKTDNNKSVNENSSNHPATAINYDLIKLNGQTNEVSSNTQNADISSTSNCKKFSLNENNVLSKFLFKTNQNSFSSSIGDVTLSEVPKMKCGNYVDNNCSVSVLNEFEGLDEESLFDDF